MRIDRQFVVMVCRLSCCRVVWMCSRLEMNSSIKNEGGPWIMLGGGRGVSTLVSLDVEEDRRTFSAMNSCTDSGLA